jgi:hypothetical protein
VARCGSFAAFPRVSFHAAGDRCEAWLPSPVEWSGFSDKIVVASHLEDRRLIVDLGEGERAVAPPVVVPGAIGDDLIAGAWSVAMWGTGAFGLGPDLGSAMPFDSANRVLAAFAVSHLSEIGFGFALRDGSDGASAGLELLLRLRTLWADPDEVVAAVEPALMALATGEPDAAARLESIAARFPQSRFATGERLGVAGPLVSVLIVNGGALVVIPAFMEYIRQRKSTEALDSLGTLGRLARDAHGAADRFPGPSAGPTPPLGSCCATGAACLPDATLWQVEPWRSLDFAIADKHYYSYEYRVADDGQTFTARAYGDLDCDGEYSTFEITGSPDISPSKPTEIQPLD